MAAEQMALQFGQIQQKNNMELVKNLTAGLGKKLNIGFSSVVGSVKTMTKTAAGNLEDKLEARKAEKVKTQRQIKWEERQDKFFGFMKSKWSSVAENKKVQATGSFLKKMLLTLLGGFALFALPPDFWTGLKNMIFDFGKWIASISWEKDIKPMLESIKNAVVAAKDFIQTIINKIFGTKDEEGNRQGGLLGKGGTLTDVMGFFGFSKEEGDEVGSTVSKFVAGLGVATTALALMFPGKAVTLAAKGIWGLAKGMGRGAGAIGSKGLSMLAGGGEAKFDRAGGADAYMTDKQKQMSKSRFANAAKAGPRVGKTPPQPKGWFSKLMGKFGKAGTFLKNVGMKVITGLLSMGPVGWGIVAAIAAGGLIWYFWDDITKVWDVVVEKVTAGFTKVKEMVGGLVSQAKPMIGGWLRGIGAGMIADWIDPDGADKTKPVKEFTFGNLMGELWDIYTGIWKEVLDLAKSAAKAVGKIAANVARKMGLGGIADWIEEKIGDKEESTLTKEVGLTKEDMNVADTRDHDKFGQWSSTPEGKDYIKSFKDDGPDGKGKTGILGSNNRRKRAHAQFLADKKMNASHGSTANDPDIDDDLSMSEGTHKKVGVSKADMGGVKWNKINSGGRQGVEDIITGIWNKHNIKAKPTFTSGYRKPKSALSLANTRSKHPHGTAFDLRSKDVPKDKQNAVFADLQSSLGIWGQHEKGDVNAGRRTGEHYHFQAAAQGFKGVVDQATIFLVGEDGAELVNVTPLSSPQNKTTAMNSLQAENAQSKMGGGNAPTVVSAPQSTTVNNQSSTALIMPPTAKSSVPL